MGIDLGGLDAIRQLRAVAMIAALLGVGLVARLLDEAGVNLLPDLTGMALWVVPIVGLFELRRVVRTLAVVGRRRQLRTEYRMPLDVPATFVSAVESPVIGQARDLSPSGMRLELPSPVERGTTARTTIMLPTIAGPPEPVHLDVEVQSFRSSGTTWTVGGRIVAATPADERRVIEYCYVVCPGLRVRGDDPVPLPRPVPITIRRTAAGTEAVADDLVVEVG